MMLFFFSFPIDLLFGCMSSLIITLVFALFARQAKRLSIGAVLGVLQLSFVIALVLFHIVGYRVQEAIAFPYVQAALDSQCGTGLSLRWLVRLRLVRALAGHLRVATQCVIATMSSGHVLAEGAFL